MCWNVAGETSENHQLNNAQHEIGGLSKELYIRVIVVIPCTADGGVLLVYHNVDVGYLLRESARHHENWYAQETFGGTLGTAHLIPAVMPLKPAPITMTFTGLYSSMCRRVSALARATCCGYLNTSFPVPND